MKRRYLRAIPVLTMLVLSQTLSFAPVSVDNVGVLETFTIESLMAKASDVVCPSVQAADWEEDINIDMSGWQDTQADKDFTEDQLSKGNKIVSNQPNQTSTTPATPLTPVTPTTPTTPITPTTPTSTRDHIDNQTNQILIVINGGILGTDASPYIQSGRTFIPIRSVAEALNCDVKWDNTTKSFKVTSADEKTVISGVSGQSQVTVNGKKVYIDSKAKDVTVMQKDGHVFAPLRFFAENMGCTVEYKDRVVYIDIQ